MLKNFQISTDIWKNQNFEIEPLTVLRLQKILFNKINESISYIDLYYKMTYIGLYKEIIKH